MELSAAMKRLLVDNVDTPTSRHFLSSASPLNDADIEAVITPFGKTSFPEITAHSSSNDSVSKETTTRELLFDEDSGLGMETDMIEDGFQLSTIASFNDSFTGFNHPIDEPRTFASPLFNVSSRKRSSAKKKLFTNKRTVELNDSEDDMSPSYKKFRNADCSLLKFALTNSPIQSSDTSVQNIIQAVDRLSTEEDLVADGSRTYSIPTILGKHGDLKSISADTMAEVVSSNMVSQKEIMIVDCRYPYEYQGGHIKGAVNLYTKEEIHKLLELPEDKRPRVIVFHCEFSSERGPKMYRFLRSSDRDMNKDNYPKLHYPEIYLLEGGYKIFHGKYQSLCDPMGYKPMLHKDHASDLRHFRVKSKSWAGGQKGSKSSRSRLSRSCLSFKY
ncbi:M-phase inducer phosphatase 1 [Mactra antiquata]